MDARRDKRRLGTALLALSVIGTMGCATHRYDRNGNHYYERYDHQHATEGAVLGGLAGAGVGRAIAGHHNDAAGYWIGGALGAITGAVIGDALDRDDDARRHPPVAPPPHRDGGYDRDDDYDRDRDDDYDRDRDDDYDRDRGYGRDRDEDRARRDHRRDRDYDADADYDDDFDDRYDDRRSDAASPRFLSLPDEVLFERGSDRLQPGAKRRLRAVATAMRDHPGTLVVVRGHASGHEGQHPALSEARARAVRGYLLKQGVAASRVTALGMGARFRVASDDTAEGRQRNRRAEIELRSARGHELAGLW